MTFLVRKRSVSFMYLGKAQRNAHGIRWQIKDNAMDEMELFRKIV